MLLCIYRNFLLSTLGETQYCILLTFYFYIPESQCYFKRRGLEALEQTKQTSVLMVPGKMQCGYHLVYIKQILLTKTNLFKITK